MLEITLDKSDFLLSKTGQADIREEAGLDSHTENSPCL